MRIKKNGIIWDMSEEEIKIVKKTIIMAQRDIFITEITKALKVIKIYF